MFFKPQSTQVGKGFPGSPAAPSLCLAMVSACLLHSNPRLSPTQHVKGEAGKPEDPWGPVQRTIGGPRIRAFRRQSQGHWGEGGRGGRTRPLMSRTPGRAPGVQREPDRHSPCLLRASSLRGKTGKRRSAQWSILTSDAEYQTGANVVLRG